MGLRLIKVTGTVVGEYSRFLNERSQDHGATPGAITTTQAVLLMAQDASIPIDKKRGKLRVLHELRNISEYNCLRH